jgi:hypothetical protein
MEDRNSSSKTIDEISGSSNHRLKSVIDLVQNKPKLIRAVLVAIAVLSGVLIFAKTIGFFITSAKAERIVKQAFSWSKQDPNVVESQLTKSKLIVDDLKEKNLFWPSPEGHPVKAVLGIFGDEAYIDGRWYKVGAKIGDARIIAIDANSITTEWKGKKKVFHPIDAGN